jgi:hypothetical protein
MFTMLMAVWNSVVGTSSAVNPGTGPIASTAAPVRVTGSDGCQRSPLKLSITETITYTPCAESVV